MYVNYLRLSKCRLKLSEANTFNSGSDGNSARLERCVFSNNHGLNTENDYGAAIVISLLTIFRQRITLPRHEIVDW